MRIPPLPARTNIPKLPKCALLILLATLLPSSVAITADGPAFPADSANDLSCRIEVPSLTLTQRGTVPASLVLTNAGKDPIRICTLCQGWRGSAGGAYSVGFTPDIWKSDSPTTKQLSEYITTLKPGESYRLPFEIDNLQGAKSKTSVVATYGVSDALASKLGVWHGAIGAKTNLQRP